jgi:hypothetical protein
MGRVAGEAAFVLDGAVYPFEQQIDGGDERRQFRRYACYRKRHQRLRLAFRDRLAYFLKGSEAAAHAEPEGYQTSCHRDQERYGGGADDVVQQDFTSIHTIGGLRRLVLSRNPPLLADAYFQVGLPSPLGWRLFPPNGHDRGGATHDGVFASTRHQGLYVRSN